MLHLEAKADRLKAGSLNLVMESKSAVRRVVWDAVMRQPWLNWALTGKPKPDEPEPNRWIRGMKTTR